MDCAGENEENCEGEKKWKFLENFIELLLENYEVVLKKGKANDGTRHAII